MLYTDWEQYGSLYGGVPEGEFERLCRRASAKLDVYTHGRAERFETAYDAETATAFQKRVHGQIADTVCELINALYAQEGSGMGSGISSVSNDGYTETYKITTAAEREAQLLSLVREGLSGSGLAGAL